MSDKQWYSAFGESGTSETLRYGYAGAHGYQTDESGDGFPFMHVGARYYDPATGRFLQRDPIGIRGGLNVYGYVENSPLAGVDPSGLGILGDILDVITKIIEDVFGIKPSPAGAARGPIKTVAEAMACGPDIARITIGKRHRDRLIDDEGDLMDALDRFDEGRNGHVKPGSGPAG